MHSSVHAERAGESRESSAHAAEYDTSKAHAVVPTCKNAGRSEQRRIVVLQSVRNLSSHDARNVHLYRSAMLANASLWQPPACAVKSLLTSCDGCAS